MKICDRCGAVESLDNPVEQVMTSEGYYCEMVCLECSSAEGTPPYWKDI